MMTCSGHTTKIRPQKYAFNDNEKLTQQKCHAIRYTTLGGEGVKIRQR